MGASMGGAAVVQISVRIDVTGRISFSGTRLRSGYGINDPAGVRRVSAPFLYVGTRDDWRAPRPEARSVFGMIGSADKKIVLYPGSDHGWDLVEQPPYDAREAPGAGTLGDRAQEQVPLLQRHVGGGNVGVDPAQVQPEPGQLRLARQVAQVHLQGGPADRGLQFGEVPADHARGDLTLGEHGETLVDSEMIKRRGRDQVASCEGSAQTVLRGPISRPSSRPIASASR